MAAALDLELSLNVTATYRQQLNDSMAHLRKVQNYVLYRDVLKEFLDDERWRRLASDPKEFNAALGNSLHYLKMFMRTKSGIQATRPTRNALRDARIFLLRHNGSPFPEIAERFNIPIGVAHRAFERHEERFHRFMEAIEQMRSLVKERPWLIRPIGEIPELP